MLSSPARRSPEKRPENTHKSLDTSSGEDIFMHQPPHSSNMWPRLVQLGQGWPKWAKSWPMLTRLGQLWPCLIKCGELLLQFGGRYVETTQTKLAGVVFVRNFEVFSGRLSRDRRGGEHLFEYFGGTSLPPPPEYVELWQRVFGPIVAAPSVRIASRNRISHMSSLLRLISRADGNSRVVGRG